MAANDVAGRLRQVERFADLSSKDLKKVAEMGTYLHQPAHWTLIPESTPADKAYVILSGTAEIRHHGDVVATVGPGAVIGEVGILEKRLRTASVISVTPLEVVHFTKKDLVTLVDSIPAFDQALRATEQEHLDADG